MTNTWNCPEAIARVGRPEREVMGKEEECVTENKYAVKIAHPKVVRASLNVQRANEIRLPQPTFPGDAHFA